MPTSDSHDALSSIQGTHWSTGNSVLICYPPGLPCLSPSRALAELAEDCISASMLADFLQAGQTDVWQCEQLTENTDMALLSWVDIEVDIACTEASSPEEALQTGFARLCLQLLGRCLKCNGDLLAKDLAQMIFIQRSPVAAYSLLRDELLALCGGTSKDASMGKAEST